jgi:signal transduction histidine kinase
MFIGDLLPAAFAALKPHRAIPAGNQGLERMWTEPPRAVRPAAALPHGLVAVAPETLAALAATGSFARSRFVDLQMAVEPALIVEADAAEYQACLRHLILGAIRRASSGVLVTATREADGVEIAVLDDGAGAPDGTTPAGEPAAPLGGTLRVNHRPDRGTSLLLWLPQPDRLPFPANAVGNIEADADF